MFLGSGTPGEEMNVEGAGLESEEVEKLAPSGDCRGSGADMLVLDPKEPGDSCAGSRAGWLLLQ